MNLLEWKQEQGISFSEIARRIPCSQPYPGMIAKGKRPSWKMATRIQEITGGAVSRTNWYPDVAPPIGVVNAALAVNYP